VILIICWLDDDDDDDDDDVVVDDEFDYANIIDIAVYVVLNAQSVGFSMF